MKKIALGIILIFVFWDLSYADEKPPVETKNKSSFQMESNSRNPFWPIGWKPTAKLTDSAMEHTPLKTAPEPAFTLLELLVVIVIVALLGAIGMPVYHKITESAYASKEVSNLRQLGIAMNLYLDDNGCFPGEQWPASLNPRY